MPLQVRCQSCERTLVLEQVFQGAHCLCKHCRHLVEVHRQTAVTRRTGNRPAHPPRVTAIDSNYVEPLPSRRVSPAPGRRAAFGWITSRVSVHRIAAGFSIVLAVLIGMVVWTNTGDDKRALRPTYNWDFADAGGEAASDSKGVVLASANPRAAILRNDPLSSYFGVPLTGSTIGYVIDCDATMAPYIDKLAVVTNSVNSFPPQGSVKFGIVQAIDDPDGSELYVVYEPGTDLAGAKTVLHTRLASGQTDLPRAFGVTEGWYSDELFLVLAKPVSETEVDRLTQLAQQSGAVTHVIAFGSAAGQQGLSRIAESTSGQFVPVSDELLDALVAKYDALADQPE